MIKNYFQIAWRNLIKNKVFSFINILGLTIGITVCAMIFLFIANQFSFDKFHSQGDRIYRVMRGFDNTKDRAPYLSAPYATALLTDYPDVIEKAVTAFGKVAPLYPFEYSFLDQKFDTLYKTDLRQQRILSLFSGLAIFIACLGLYGLASFTAAKRNKEIGIRKVLGASVSGVTTLLSRDFIKPLLVALIIASPIAWLVMNKWLEDFAYRIQIQWWLFVLAGLITIGIALITVSWQAIRAAVANPVKSLRDE